MKGRKFAGTKLLLTSVYLRKVVLLKFDYFNIFLFSHAVFVFLTIHAIFKPFIILRYRTN